MSMNAIVQNGGQIPLMQAVDVVPTSIYTTTTSRFSAIPTIAVEHEEEPQIQDLIDDLTNQETKPCHSSWLAQLWSLITHPINKISTLWTTTTDDDDDEALRQIPQFVLDYAPYCWLYSGEDYWPGTMEEHLEHTIPYLHYESLGVKPNIDEIHHLNKYGYKNVFLTSEDDPEGYPYWMSGQDNIPDSEGYSPAPAILIVVDKGSHVDAFWFFWYSFNLGNQVLGVRFGNHVGDWEHTMIRFSKKNGRPTSVFFSEHEWGSGYSWNDCDLDGNRLYTYSAYGTHAMYRTSGDHPYGAPGNLLKDTTDRGYLWDPLLNLRSYTYDPKHDIIRASTLDRDAPENWFHFKGKWGDKYYPLSDRRQYKLGSELHYSSGPTGPWKKNLGRKGPCQNPKDEVGCLAVEGRADEWDGRAKNFTMEQIWRWRVDLGDVDENEVHT